MFLLTIKIFYLTSVVLLSPLLFGLFISDIGNYLQLDVLKVLISTINIMATLLLYADLKMDVIEMSN